MKKIVCAFCFLFSFSSQTIFAQYAKIMLHHENQVSAFDFTELQEAINASVDGDIIYIPEGPCDSKSVEITKCISVIGQGEKSKIGDVTIDLSGGSELNSPILYGLTAGKVSIISSVIGLHIDKCTMNGLYIRPASSTTTQTFVLRDLLIERSLILGSTSIYKSDELTNCTFSNCKFNSSVSNDEYSIAFVNCSFGSSTSIGHFYNSIMSSSISTSMYCVYVNCLISSTIDKQIARNVYVDNKRDYSDEELKVKGYLGTDGMIIGCNGGIRPFDLNPALPSLEDYKMDVNYDTNKLNITVRLKAN